MNKNLKTHSLKNLALTGLASLALAGCVTAAKAPPVERMTFESLDPFPIYVASYEIQNQTPEASGIIPQDERQEDGFVASVNKTVEDYLQHRFSSVGSNGKFLAVLKEASLKKSVLPSDNKVGAWMQVDNRDRYDMKVVVHMAIFGVGQYEKKSIDVIANRMITVPEHYTLAEREQLQMQALDNLLDDLDGSIQQVLKEDFQILQGY